MLFAVGPGTEGGGEERFSAYLPFELSPGKNISPIEGTAQRLINGRIIKVEKFEKYYALVQHGYGSEREAEEGLEWMHTALLWISLKYKVGIKHQTARQGMKLLDEPAPAPEKGMISAVMKFRGWDVSHGSYDADKAAIIPEHLNLVRWQMGAATVHTGIGIDNFFRELEHVQENAGPRLSIANPKLRLALEVYGSFAFESSENAQLLTLVTALEALIPEYNISPTMVEALDAAKVAFKEARKTTKATRVLSREFERLASRLGDLKRESIGASLGRFVTELTTSHPELGVAGELEQKLKNIYGIRSRLIHDGHFSSSEVSESREFLCDFVPSVLKLAFHEDLASN